MASARCPSLRRVSELSPKSIPRRYQTAQGLCGPDRITRKVHDADGRVQQELRAVCTELQGVERASPCPAEERSPRQQAWLDAQDLTITLSNLSRA